MLASGQIARLSLTLIAASLVVRPRLFTSQPVLRRTKRLDSSRPCLPMHMASSLPQHDRARVLVDALTGQPLAEDQRGQTIHDVPESFLAGAAEIVMIVIKDPQVHVLMVAFLRVC